MPSTIGALRKHVGRFRKNVGVFPKNVGDFSKNVGVFFPNVGDFSKNVGVFFPNVGVFLLPLVERNFDAPSWRTQCLGSDASKPKKKQQAPR